MKAQLILIGNEAENRYNSLVYNLAVKNNYCIFHKRVNEKQETESVFTFENIELLSDFIMDIKRFEKRYK